MNQKEKAVFDKYVSMRQAGQNFHRYDMEAEFEQINKKKYQNPQIVELLLKKAAESNIEYRLLFDEIYGDMPKYKYLIQEKDE